MSYKSSTLGASTGGRSEETHARSIRAQATPYRHDCRKCGARRIDQQIGLEETPDAWAAALVAVFREARRVLRKDGTLWVECGDSYASSPAKGGSGPGSRNSPGYGRPFRPGSGRADGIVDERGQRNRDGVEAPPGYKPKDLLGTPWFLAFALRADGWWLRGCNIWAKPNAMPESAKDRCTTAHSYVFQLSKSARYFFDGDAISEPAAWERWGDQTTPKHEGTETAAGWIPAQSKDELQGRYVNQYPDGNGRFSDSRLRDDPGVKSMGGRADRADGLKHPRSVWNIPTQGYPEAHFATWPEALARRIILAGCPEAVCSVCGKARERIVETERVDSRPGHSVKLREITSGNAAATGRAGEYASQTLGYTDCGHNAYEPGVILDPFVGSGTTCFVARKLGRRSIGIDLSAEYLDLAAKRLQQQSLFA